MNRRDNLKLLLAGSVGAALPASALAGIGEWVFAFDGRFAVARGMARQVPWRSTASMMQPRCGSPVSRKWVHPVRSATG